MTVDDFFIWPPTTQDSTSTSPYTGFRNFDDRNFSLAARLHIESRQGKAVKGGNIPVQPYWDLRSGRGGLGLAFGVPAVARDLHGTRRIVAVVAAILLAVLGSCTRDARTSSFSPRPRSYLLFGFHGFLVGHRSGGGNLAPAEDHTPAPVGFQTRNAVDGQASTNNRVAQGSFRRRGRRSCTGAGEAPLRGIWEDGFDSSGNGSEDMLYSRYIKAEIGQHLQKCFVVQDRLR